MLSSSVKSVWYLEDGTCGIADASLWLQSRSLKKKPVRFNRGDASIKSVEHVGLYKNSQNLTFVGVHLISADRTLSIFLSVEVSRPFRLTRFHARGIEHIPLGAPDRCESP